MSTLLRSLRSWCRSPEPVWRGGLRLVHAAAIALLAGALTVAACTDLTGPADGGAPPGELPVFSHGSFTFSQGIYRIPYADGVEVTVTQDHHTHGGETGAKDRIDMTAGVGAVIVASASGWIRGIVDRHGNSPGAGDGQDINGDPQDDSLEHACQDEIDEEGNRIPDSVVTGLCQHYNNYVWIEHPNGEWTKYSHFGTGTVSANGWSVGDWIEAGEVLGLENDVGVASGAHLHYEVGVPNDPTDPTPFSTNGGFIQGVNRVPLVCGIFTYSQGLVATADPCNHQPPTADAGGPYATSEGTAIVLDGTGSLDPEGRPLTYRWEPAEFFEDPSLAQPTFRSGDNMIVFVELYVYDQVEALWDSTTAMVVVGNVPPAVTIDPGQTTAIDEGGEVTVTAEFTDPGWLDTHTVSIDWGVPAGHPGNQLGSPTIQILDAGGPGTPRRGRVTGRYRYGDNDDGSGFTVAVTVTDDDGGWGVDGFSLTVHNVAPSAAIDPAGTVPLNGVPTVVASAGEDVTFDSHTLDPGSDDLTLAWNWDDGTGDSRLSLVNPPTPDPLPSPTVQPRSEPDQRTHAFAGACMYRVTFSATDDDGGSGEAAIDVMVAGTADRARGSGYWSAEYRLQRNPDFPPASLECFLTIVNHASAVFSAHRPLASLHDAAQALRSAGSGGDADALFDVQLLAAWLNFANGAYALGQPVDTSGDGSPDTAFHQVLLAAETLRTDPNRARADVLAMKDVLERLNTADD
jgi:hypothetical protein